MSSNNDKVFKYNLFYIAFCIVWTPLQLFYIKIDGYGRLQLFFSIIAIVLNFSAIFKRKGSLRSKAFGCWLLLVLYTFVNSMIKGFKAETGALLFIRSEFIDPLIFLIIIIISLSHDRIKSLKTIFIAEFSYLVFGALNMSLMDDGRVFAMGLGNMLPLMTVSTLFVAGILLCEKQLRWGWKLYLAVFILALYIVVLSGTRKALGAIVLVFVGTIVADSGKNTVRMWVVLTISAIIGMIGFNWMMSNTFMGSRLTDIGEQFDYTFSSNPVINSFILDFLGDRSFFYFFGLQIFHQHPLTGIGIRNFATVNMSNLRLHTEYITQLCENGIIGFSLLLIFYYLIFRGLRKRKNEWDGNVLYMTALLAIIFIDFTAWTYNMLYVMIMYGILIARIYPAQLNSKSTN